MWTSCTPHGIAGHVRWADSSLWKGSLISQIARRSLFSCAPRPSHMHLLLRSPRFMTRLSAGCRFVADGAFWPVHGYIGFDPNPVSRKCAPLGAFGKFPLPNEFEAPECQPSVKVRYPIQFLLCHQTDLLAPHRYFLSRIQNTHHRLLRENSNLRLRIPECRKYEYHVPLLTGRPQVYPPRAVRSKHF